jgi:hypothetical protein
VNTAKIVAKLNPISAANPCRQSCAICLVGLVFSKIVIPKIATSGAKLLKDDAIESIKNDLIPMAVLITPNLDEASLLLGKEIKYEDLTNLKYTTCIIKETLRLWPIGNLI